MSCNVPTKCFHVYVCSDGLGAEGSEWLAEDGEGRLEQVDSGTESADDRCANREIKSHLCSHFLQQNKLYFLWVFFFFKSLCLYVFAASEKMARAIAQETQQLETELNEERSRYQNLLTEHLRLEEKYEDLKEDMASSVSDTQAGGA